MACEIEVVEDGVRWNAKNPPSKTMLPHSRIDQIDETTTLFSGKRNKRLALFVERFSGQFHAEAMYTIIRRPR